MSNTTMSGEEEHHVTGEESGPRVPTVKPQGSPASERATLRGYLERLLGGAMHLPSNTRSARATSPRPKVADEARAMSRRTHNMQLALSAYLLGR